MSDDSVTVNRIDLRRTLDRLARARYVGTTPGEKEAERRLYEALAARPRAASSSADLGELYDLLAAAGFDELEDIRTATDEELLSIDGIGPAKLRKIREAVAVESPS